MHLEELYLSDN
jgi:Leucine-rich repeat (LRR) protein